MSKSVAELAQEVGADLERTTGVVAAPQLAAPGHMAPVPTLMWLEAVLNELGLDTGFLDGARDLMVRARELRLEAVTAQQQASQRRQSALATLGRDNTASLADAVDLWAAQAPWLDVEPGKLRAPALELAERAAVMVESNIVGVVFSHAPRLWDLVQRKAKAIVDEVAALPAMPRDIWLVSDPASEFAKFKAHHATWGILLAAHHDFWNCHQIGDLVRDQLGYGFPNFPPGAPRTSLWLRRWHAELGDDTFARLKAPLRLRYAIDKGFQPGLWAPREVEYSTAADRSFGGRLKNLGVAVGRNI